MQNYRKVNLCCFKPLCLWWFVTAARGMSIGPDRRIEDTLMGRPRLGEGKDQSWGWRGVCGSWLWRGPPGPGGQSLVGSSCSRGLSHLAHKPETQSMSLQHLDLGKSCSGSGTSFCSPSWWYPLYLGSQVRNIGTIFLQPPPGIPVPSPSRFNNLALTFLSDFICHRPSRHIFLS